MSVNCTINEHCGRFQVCSIYNYCQHQSLYEDQTSQIIALVGFVIIEVFSFSTGLGIVPVLVLSLQIWLNFNKQENVGQLQLIQMTMSLLIILVFSRSKHPYRKSLIIDLRLSSILLPTLIAGLYFGIYLRNYVPPFVLSFFTTLQLFLMCGIQFQRLRESQKIHSLQQSVKLKIIQGDQFHDDKLADEVIVINLDSVEIDFQKLFERIKNSKHKSLYLEQLPPQFHNLQIMDPQTNNLVKVCDYLSDQQHSSVFALEGQKQTQSLDVNEINLMLAQDVKKLNAQFNFANEFIQPPPILEICILLLILIYNIIIQYVLSSKSQSKFIHIEGEKTCFTEKIWILLLFQFIGNGILFIIATVLLFFKEKRLLQIFNLMIENKLNQLNVSREFRQEVLSTHQGVHFFGFSINMKTTIQFFLTGVISGFTTGFVGLGSLIILIAMLKNLNLQIKSLMTTIALMAFCVTLLGVLLQELMGIISWGNCVLLFFLTIIGILISVPIKKSIDKKLNWMHRIIWSDLIFYIVLTFLYIILWIVNIVKKADRETDTSIRNICGQEE